MAHTRYFGRKWRPVDMFAFIFDVDIVFAWRDRYISDRQQARLLLLPHDISLPWTVDFNIYVF